MSYSDLQPLPLGDGMDDIDYADDIPDIKTSATIGLKIERTLMAFLYCVMLTVACTNIWNFLIKKKMYTSYPMTTAYIILVVYSIISIAYELYMSIGCGEHDCLASIYTINKIADEGGDDGKKFRTHWEVISVIGKFWRVRQQL